MTLLDVRNVQRALVRLVEDGEIAAVGTGKRGVIVYEIRPGGGAAQPTAEAPYVETPDLRRRRRTAEASYGAGDGVPTAEAPYVPTAEAPDKPSLNHQLEPSLMSMSDEAVNLWNELASEIGLAPVQRLTQKRRSKLAARLKECDGLAGWGAALAKVRASPFLRGEGDNGWRCTLDWLLDPTNLAKAVEGAYAPKPGNGAEPSNTAPGSSDPWVLEDGTIVPDSEFDAHLDRNHRIAAPLRPLLTREQFRALDIARKSEAQCRELVARWTNGLDGA
jgi:hypothetical protein